MLLLVPFAAQSSNWAHNAISLTHAFGDGSGVKVGVMDGAARCSHVELAGHCVNTYYDPDWGQYSDHGTHVATTIAGIDKAPDWFDHDGGVAPGATIYSYEVFDGEYWISNANETAMADKAASDGVSVINMSYGAYNAYGMPYIEENVKKIWRKYKNITFVNASGNEGVILDASNVGNIENVIFVGASDQSGNIAGWSNRPGEHYKYQFIVAPGDFISGGYANSDGAYGWMSGTSMAAPIVTGAIAILHDHWGHLKNNPVATAGIVFDSAIDKGAPGVDAVYGHGMLNIAGMFGPIPITDDPDDDDCPIVIVDPPVDNPGDGGTIGTPGDGVWYDGKGEGRSWYDSRGRKYTKNCDQPEDPPVVVNPPEDPPVVVNPPEEEPCYLPWAAGPPSDDCTIGTPGDGIWYDDRGNRNYYTVNVNGKRKLLNRPKASSVLIKAASKLPVVFFDKYGRDFKTNAVNYKSVDRIDTEYLELNENMSLQMVNNSMPNFKMKLTDNVSVGRGRTLGFESNPVLNMLDDGAFIIKDNVGVMYSDTSTTLLYKPEDWLTMTYTKENGFLGSTGMGKYDTISTTVSKDYGMFFSSTTMALSSGGDDRGIVKMSDKVGSLAFQAGLKGEIKKNLNWKLAVSQNLQPVSGTMSVAYDDRAGRTITNHVDLDDDTTTKIMFTLKFKW